MRPSNATEPRPHNDGEECKCVHQQGEEIHQPNRFSSTRGEGLANWSIRRNNGPRQSGQMETEAKPRSSADYVEDENENEEMKHQTATAMDNETS